MVECAKGAYSSRRFRETVYKYLGCGDLKQGFARVRCRECGHEYLLAYSCKRRYFCTSCHTTRAVAFAEWLHETALWTVAHRQIVLTIPKMLRAYFRSLWDEARPPPVTPGAVARAPDELAFLPWAE